MTPQVRLQGSSCAIQEEVCGGGRNLPYLLEVRVSHHALQVVKDGVSLHGRQGLPGHVAGGLVLTLHFGGCGRREAAVGYEPTLREGVRGRNDRK